MIKLVLPPSISDGDHRDPNDKTTLWQFCKLILLFIIPWLLLAWCSSTPIDYNILTQHKIGELETQATLYQEQCNKLDSTKKDIDNLKAYINGKEITHAVATTTKWFARCIDNSDTMTEKRVNYEDYSINESCDKFAWFRWCYTNSKESCLIFSSIEDMNKQLQ